jgi:transposase-like protein
MRIIDGHHRRRAAQIRGDEEVLVRFFDGSATDAFVLAVQVNVMHGLPLSAQDRASAAGRILQACPDWSDRAIAAAAGLTAKTVAAIRRRETTADERSRPRLGSDGRVRPISNVEGRRRAGQLLQKNPDASLREIARRVGISPGTVRDVRDRLRRGEDVVPARRLPIPAERQPVEALIPPTPLALSGVTLTIGQLRRDPSLRMTNFGRQLLRLLDLGVLPVLQMDQMVEMVPEHATPQVAMVARACALGWLRMADLLERREQTHDGSAVPGISAAQA